MKFLKLAGLAVVALLGQQVEGASTFSPARPPAAPLAVRSPYLNVWLNGRTDGGPSGYLAGQWPRFWTQQVQGWQGYVTVDGKSFNWMGAAPGAPNVDQVSLEYTSTKTTFVMNVDGKVQMSIKFMSPVYYNDLRRQSVTSSYLEVLVKSLDGRSHSVQVYCDVSAEWASGDRNAVVQWETNSKDGIRYHKFYRQNQQPFTEASEVASWGHWYWATGDKVRGLSYQIGADTDVRAQFLSKGSLTGDIDKNFRAVGVRWPVFAFSRDLGAVGSSWTSTLFTIGYTQDEAILFQGKDDTPMHVPSLWKQWFNEDELVTFFYNDYDYASHNCNRLDIRIADDSKAAGGQDYLTITSLAVRQVFGALAFTNTQQQPLVFLKEISSNSDIQTVDVIFPAFPIMLYLNPDLIKWTLDPLLENGRWHYPKNWAQHDLGTFPVAPGHPKGDDEAMPLEECGNMVIMMLAHAQRKHNNQYRSDNWDMLQKWAQYLIDDSKIPANQLSTDDFAGHLANQTNLAIKGIIALEAMSQIADLTGHKDQKEKYTKIAHEYLDFWSVHGINSQANPKHTVLQYDNPSTYGLLYNIYPDKVLGLNFIPQSVYDMQSDFYQSIQNEYGVILDTRGTLTKLDWEMFAAAVAKPETRNMFISKIASWIGRTTTWRAYTDLYDTKTGGYANGIEFTARPVLGGVFSLLALKQ
ncbi:hypothetical protein TOPH_06998 [Tolypocladium ophioglossoides CBS 100239]|uniref:Glutaminase A n=1 Tax=Tolypocladium ophioglossoides (strain CBS 100239) TaxID=1163406 RepID=A0A0L0N2T6_TOLOC|nr:hypothetical protein TOPH_06998 [Tolypocladium ophioglossoides CBS 100239]